MKKIIFYSLFALIVSTTPTWALSCASVEGAEDAIPQNELIVKAKVIDITTAMRVPLLQEHGAAGDIITFEIIDLYKGPEETPRKFKAHMSNFYKTWGPHLKEGDTGEYLFDVRKAGGWDYAGPGGCNFISEKAWQTLRENARP